MYIKRKLEDTILKYLGAKEIIAIIGPRQSGKTTMANKIMSGLKNCSLISFEDIKILQMFEKETDDFIKLYVKGKKYLFIDEFQYSKNGGKILKYIYDSQNIKIIISGSSAADISIQAVKYLVGRVLIFTLYPFDFYEFLFSKDKKFFHYYLEHKDVAYNFDGVVKISETADRILMKYYEEYLIFGGYPRVVLEKDIGAKKILLRNIYNTYFLREVKDILGLIDDYMLENLIKALALQIGNMVEYDELSKTSGFSFLTLKKYLNFIEKTFICKLVKPFFKNKRTEIVKNPKVYFIDTGLRNSIIDDFRGLNDRTDKGPLIENGLAMQFAKNDLVFNYWRDKQKNEIDFILSLGEGKIVAVESKSYLKNIPQSISKFGSKYPDIKLKISYVKKDKRLEYDNVVPLYLF